MDENLLEGYLGDLSDEVIDDSALFHGRVYDPVKAREYYLRTRVLKGRAPGAGPDPPREVKPRAVGSVEGRKSSGEARRAQLRKEQAALEKRLDRLREVLRDLVQDAQKKSGGSTAQKQAASKTPSETKSSTSKTSSSSSSKSKTSSSSSKDKPATASEKKEAAKRAQESYEKNKAPSVGDKLERKNDNLQAQIKDIQERIQKALDNSRKNRPAVSAKGTIVKPPSAKGITVKTASNGR